MGALQTNVLGLIPGLPKQVTNLPAAHAGTILMDGNSPTFVVELPNLRRIPPNNLGAKLNIKPAAAAPINGYLVPVISHFWPLWEGTGNSITDYVGVNPANLAAGLTWVQNLDPAYGAPWSTTAQPCIHRGAVAPNSTEDITLGTPLVLTGEWSIDFCWRPVGTYFWVHTVIVNTIANGIAGYVYGVQDNTWNTGVTTPLVNGQYAPSFTITGLLQAIGYRGNGSIELEFMRTWRRALNLVEIQTLAQDPFCMFGITAAVLAEITAIINFMIPTKENWYFTFSG